MKRPAVQRWLPLTLFASLLLLPVSLSRADVRLPKIFGDSMVMQQKMKNPIWGWAEAGEKITVTVNKVTATAVTGDDGKWMVRIDAPPVGGPYTISVEGANTITLKDILCGEVWVCSGQSNMQWAVTRAKNPQQEIENAKYPQIRLFQVARRIAEKPVDDVSGQWQACTPATVKNFSAVGYFFGRELHKELKVPVGLVQSAWGGTLCEAWTSQQGLEGEPDFKPILDRAAKFNGKTPNQATNLYDAMIHPLAPLAIQGAIWYQGESNVNRAQQYAKLFPAMIRDWRRVWGQGDFPFLFVQLAPFHYRGKAPTACAELWEAQLKTLSLPNTGMAVTTDIGNVNDMHPKNKQDVGKRLALWALGTTYGKEVDYSGPLYDGFSVDGDKIRIKFKHAVSGLVSKGGPLSHFTIAGADEKFVPASATIDGETVVVQSDQVKKPVAVRFGWNNKAEPNLFNKAGLPASPFRTDNWKMATDGQK